MSSLTPRLRVAQVAELWGVSDTHVYGLIESGKLRAIRIGSAIRLRVEDIEEYEAASILAITPSASTTSSLPARVGNTAASSP